MARKIINAYTPSSRGKRPNVHSKNASVGQSGYKKNTEDKVVNNFCEFNTLL